MKTVVCAVCGNSAENRFHTAREMMFGFRDQFEYLECAACGCLQIAELPRDLSKYYPAEYYSFEKLNAPAMTNRDCVRRSWRRLKYLVHRWAPLLGRLIARAVGPVPLYEWLMPTGVGPSSSILDVGSGSGSLLLALGRLGFTNLTGVDPFIETDISYGIVKIYKREVTEMAGTFDLVVLNHSLEHIPDQLRLMRELSRLLRPQGSVLIRTPVAGTFAWKHYGVNWVQLDPPRHLFIHTTRSIQILAGTAGFRIAGTVFDSGAFQFWGSEQYLRDIPLRAAQSYAMHGSNGIFTPSDIRLFETRAAGLNCNHDGDQARFYLRKR